MVIGFLTPKNILISTIAVLTFPIWIHAAAIVGFLYLLSRIHPIYWLYRIAKALNK